MPSRSAKSTAAMMATSTPSQKPPCISTVMAKPYAPSSMNPACPKFSRPVYPKCRLRPTAAIAKAAVTDDRICWPKSTKSWFRKSIVRPFGSTDAFAAAEDALGPEDQHQDEDEQRTGVAQIARQEDARQLHHEADDERADQ